MIVNFNDSNFKNYYTDICIVGSGATGLTCAAEFRESEHNVILLEAGNIEFNELADDCHKGYIDGKFHEGFRYARERIFGGTTTKWGGQLLEFLEEDFHQRGWVNNSGWPIKFRDLEHYYKRAYKLLGINFFDNLNFDPWEYLGLKKVKFSQKSLDFKASRYVKVPNFGISIYELIKSKKNIQIFQNAAAVEINLDDKLSEVVSLTIKSLQGKTGKVYAKKFILAHGCLEIPRLLLNSNKEIKCGIGNENDNVGRYFQDHIAAIVGILIPKNNKLIKENFNSFLLNKIKYMPRLFVNPDFAERKKKLHSTIQLIYSKNYLIDESNINLNTYKQIYKNIREKKKLNQPFFQLIRLLIKLPSILPDIYVLIFKKRISQPRSKFIWIECHSEQEPLRESRITLDPNKKDILGMNRIHLDWKINEKTYETIKQTSELIKSEFEQRGIGEVLLDDWIEKYNSNWRSHVGDVYHQSGTTRMSEKAKNGVVDTNLKLFNHPNLFVAGSSVFPTSSAANPTFTAIALSIRLCDHIKKIIT